jgi:hypothetical protein
VPLEFAQNLAHASALYRHSREADNVGASALFEIDWLDVLVNQGDPVLGRGEGSEQGKGCRRHDGALPEKRHCVLESKEGNIKLRTDEDDLRHVVRTFTLFSWSCSFLAPSYHRFSRLHIRFSRPDLLAVDMHSSSDEENALLVI